MAPLRQKLSSGRASLLAVIREDVLAVQPFNWGASVTWEFKWEKSRPFSSSQCWCLGMTGGTREERGSEDGGRHKGNRLQQRAGRRKNIVYFLVVLIFWDLRNSFKTPWATERDDDWFGQKKVPGILTLHDLFFASGREEIGVCTVNFITSNLEVSVSVFWQHLTVVLWEL